MARLTEQATAELTRTLPSTEETKQHMRTYLATANLSIEQFAVMVGYSQHTIAKFFHNRLPNDLLVRRAIEDFISKHPVGVMHTAASGHLYETENVQEIRQWFNHCHANRALGYVYGPPGSQKSFVLEHTIADFNRRELANSRNRAYLVYASINISPRDIIRKVCREAGAPSNAGIQRSMDALRYELRGTRTTVVVDEGQHLSFAALEAIREMNDHDPHIAFLLAGSHALRQLFDQHAATLEQWNSRMDFGVELSGISDAAARAIITAEIPDLSADEIAEIIEGSRVPDIYSRIRDRKYISMRRLFKGLRALREMEAEAEIAATQGATQ